MGEAASVLHEYESSPLVTVFSLRTYAPDMELRLIIPRTEGLGGLFERQIIKAEENKNLRVPVSAARCSPKPTSPPGPRSRSGA